MFFLPFIWMYSCFWHSSYNVSLDSKSKCLYFLEKKIFFFCSYNIITLLHHSLYHSLFYWSISYPLFFSLNLTMYFILHQMGTDLYPWPASLASSKPFLNVSHSFGGGSTRTICSFQDIGAPKWHSNGFFFIPHFPPNSWYSVWVFGWADIFSLVS